MTGMLEEKEKSSSRKNTCEGRKKDRRVYVMNYSQLSMPGAQIYVRE